MSFRETGHSDSETTAFRMRAGFVESSNEFDQIDRMLKRVPRFIVSDSSRPIATERENVSNSRLRVPKENLLDLVFVVADARQMRNRIQLCCVLNGSNQGRTANTLAGKPEPPFGFGKLTMTIAPASGT